MTTLEGDLAKARTHIEILTGANRGLADKVQRLKLEVHDLRKAIADLLEERSKVILNEANEPDRPA